MLKVNHTPTPHDSKSYTIEGDDVDTLIDACLSRIRPQSKDFYEKQLRSDLDKCTKSLIDRHAGMGIYYNVKLIK